MIRVAVLCIAFCSSLLLAETHIAGSIQKMNFDMSGNPYIVEQDIVIPTGVDVVIKEGCVFLFKPYTGLNIQGRLLIEGTGEKPVVFTTVNDADYNPASKQLANPFDWNGILVARESTGAILQNVLVRFSTYGIKSQNLNIVIQNGKFRQNGQFHFTINDKIQYVQDDISYSYGAVETGTTKTTATGTLKDTINIKTVPLAKKKEYPRIPLRITGVSVGVAGLALGAVFAIQSAPVFVESQKQRVITNGNPTKTNLALDDQLRKQYNVKLIPAIACGALGVLGLTGFTLTFVF